MPCVFPGFHHPPNLCDLYEEIFVLRWWVVCVPAQLGNPRPAFPYIQAIVPDSFPPCLVYEYLTGGTCRLPVTFPAFYATSYGIPAA